MRINVLINFYHLKNDLISVERTEYILSSQHIHAYELITKGGEKEKTEKF